MIYDQFDQGSAEWLKLRCGKITASKLDKIVIPKTAAPCEYAFRLASERVLGVLSETKVTPSMERGRDFEPAARAIYAQMRDVTVTEVAFVAHDTIPNFGASPDGLIDLNGGLECKVPEPHNYIKHRYSWAKTGEPPSDYVDQVLGNLSCSGREWWDLMLYCPELAGADHDHFVYRFHREKWQDKIAKLEERVRKFDALVEDIVSSVVLCGNNPHFEVEVERVLLLPNPNIKVIVHAQD